MRLSMRFPKVAALLVVAIAAVLVVSISLPAKADIPGTIVVTGSARTFCIDGRYPRQMYVEYWISNPTLSPQTFSYTMDWSEDSSRGDWTVQGSSRTINNFTLDPGRVEVVRVYVTANDSMQTGDYIAIECVFDQGTGSQQTLYSTITGTICAPAFPSLYVGIAAAFAAAVLAHVVRRKLVHQA